MEIVLLPDAEKDLVFWKSNGAVLKRITQNHTIHSTNTFCRDRKTGEIKAQLSWMLVSKDKYGTPHRL